MKRPPGYRLPVSSNGTPDTLEIWFIRHGQTDWNLNGLIQGASDTDLNETGRLQAERLRQRLAGTHFDAVWASDLKRAMQTAQIALPGHVIVPEPRLRELNAGEVEGRSFVSLPEETRAVWSALWTGDSTVRPPGGESYQQVLDRVRLWLAELPSRGRVAAVVHGGVVHAAVRHTLGQYDGWRAGPSMRFANTSISEVHLSGGRYSIVRLNDHAHLEGFDSPAASGATRSHAAEPRVENVADTIVR